MSKRSQLRCVAVVGLASACASATAPAAHVTAVEPVELRASRTDVGASALAPAAESPHARVLLVVSMPSDRSGALDDAARAQVAARLGRALERDGYAAAAPEASPTAAELEARGQLAFAVAPMVERAGAECRIEIRIAPWRGRDRGEHWVTGRTALVHATARVVGGAARDAARDCVEAAIEDAAARHVVQFLDGVAAAP